MALGSNEYVPILKARDAEIKAALNSPMSLDMTPLFELQKASAPSKDKKTGLLKRSKGTATDASYFLDDIARLWTGHLYIDIGRVATPAARATWWKLLAALNALAPVPADLIPVLRLDATSAERQAAAAVASITGRAALRLPMAQLHSRPTNLTGTTATYAADLQVTVSNLDVVLDWAESTELLPLDALVASTAATISALGSNQHGRLITAGTPNSAAFVQDGDWSVPRREWLLWLRLAHAGYDVTFGDYALYPGADPVPVQPQYGHLRYSSGNDLHVHRRAKPASGGGLGAAFELCCKHLIAASHWLGASFSAADRRMDAIAASSDKETQAGKWRELAAQHHFVLVDTQLASPPPSPPPGTP